MNTLPEGAVFNAEDFATWRISQLKFPNFQFWDLILRFQNLILILVSGIRNRDLMLYLAALEKIVPFMFALDNPNYARWVSVYLDDMKTLTPEFLLQYLDNWSIYTTPKPFSAMHSDQHGEQMIKEFKSQGGASNVTQQPAAMLRRNLTSGEIESMLQSGMKPDSTVSVSDESNEDSDEELPAVAVLNHHSHGMASQQRFTTQVGLFVEAIDAIGNMFADTSAELYVLKTRQVMPKSVAESYSTIEAIGTLQFLKFHKELIENCDVSINEPITRNNALLFSRLPKVVAKDKTTILSLKHDSNLLYRALTVSAVRDLSVDDVLLYENQEVPPSLGTQNGDLRKTTKSDTLQLLLNVPGDAVTLTPPTVVHTRVLDGAAIIHLLKIKATMKIKTFRDFFFQIVNPYLENLLLNCEEVSLVFDIYQCDSLKNAERIRRGAGGTTYAIVLQTPLPKDFQAFLRNDKN